MWLTGALRSFVGALSKSLLGWLTPPQGAFLHPMNIADTRLTLDGYRIQVLEKLKGCRDPGAARDLLVEVDVLLAASELSPSAQQTFWHALSTDLEIVAEESVKLLAKDAAARLTEIIGVAQSDIAQYLVILSS